MPERTNELPGGMPRRPIDRIDRSKAKKEKMAEIFDLIRKVREENEELMSEPDDTLRWSKLKEVGQPLNLKVRVEGKAQLLQNVYITGFDTDMQTFEIQRFDATGTP